MRVIIFSKTKRLKYHIPFHWFSLAFIILLVLATSLGYGAAKIFSKPVLVTNKQLATVMAQPVQEIADARKQAQRRLDSYSTYLANMQARLVRLDALGERLTALAGIADEFDFSEQVGLGRSEKNQNKGSDIFSPPTFMKMLDNLADKIETREKQLEVLEQLIAKQTLTKENYIAGQPVANGRITSGYGVRVDPITGRSKGHKGIDFSAPRGSNIMAVAGGVVTFSGWKNGYGNVVEISHLDGFKTIYAHNQQNLVKAGEVVQSSQTIAKVGSTGRSTGSHVHFEVVKNNQVVNPISFINRINKLEAVAIRTINK